MSSRRSTWHITGWVAFALIPIAIPVILVLKLFGIGKSCNRTADDVAVFIRNFIEDTGEKWDWDDFISVPITDPKLESIRIQAAMIKLPLDSAGTSKLKELLAETEFIRQRSPTNAE